MRSILTRIAALGIAGLVAASAIMPAAAATRHKRAAAPAQSVSVEGAQLPIRPDWSPVPAPAYDAANSCVTDEGYGRYASCEQGGF